MRVDRSHGVAPHKPILLLSVLQLFEQNVILSSRIYITPELVSLFKTNWNLLVKTNHNCLISYPFYHLKSEGFWQLVPKSGNQDINALGSLVKSFSTLNAAVDYANISDDLYTLMKDRHNNAILQHFLLDEYFPDSKSSFARSISIQKQLFVDIETKILSEPAEAYRLEIKKLIEERDEEEIYIRGGVFKREIPRIYHNTCCISGMRIDAANNISMIDACHIVPFSESYDDTITNGIALCPNLHRAFDRGLIAIDGDYKVVVSKSFRENDTIYSLKAFEGKQIILPKMNSFFPLRENFEWHTQNVFKT